MDVRRRHLLGAALAAGSLAAAALLAWETRPGRPGDRRELVVLVHGLARTPLSMFVLGRRLERAGYRVGHFGYVSVGGGVAALGPGLAAWVRRVQGDASRVHYVGHSLGCIVIRWLLAHARPPRSGRVVMLAPPNQGAAAADRWARWLGWAVPHLHDLGTHEGSVARSLRLPADVDVGVIAGERDGTVRVEETHLEGERDHVLVPCQHTFIMNRADVHRMVCRFLHDGRFAEVPGVDA
jgi:triacylglycerol lipase